MNRGIPEKKDTDTYLYFYDAAHCFKCLGPYSPRRRNDGAGAASYLYFAELYLLFIMAKNRNAKFLFTFALLIRYPWKLQYLLI